MDSCSDYQIQFAHFWFLNYDSGFHIQSQTAQVSCHDWMSFFPQIYLWIMLSKYVLRIYAQSISMKNISSVQWLSYLEIYISSKYTTDKYLCGQLKGHVVTKYSYLEVLLWRIRSSYHCSMNQIWRRRNLCQNCKFAFWKQIKLQMCFLENKN